MYIKRFSSETYTDTESARGRRFYFSGHQDINRFGVLITRYDYVSEPQTSDQNHI